jgi:hypothetical protein
MTKAEKRRLILRLTEQWIVPLYLGGWTVHVHFPKRISETASCDSSPEYLSADFYYNLVRVPDTVAEIEELVAHEMCHPHVEALAGLAVRGARRTPERREAIRVAEERLTSTIAHMILPSLRALA